MLVGIIYFIVIIIANTVGAISGMGGGVIIKPVMDLFGFHSVAAISFYSTVAVFTMSISSTLRQLESGQKVHWRIVVWVSLGSILGGIFGNLAFEALLLYFANEQSVQLLQIVLTIFTLAFAFLYTRCHWRSFTCHSFLSYFLCGLLLGFLSSLLGIGGGPINVALLMLLFSMPIKSATFYSICTIFFSQLAKLITIATGLGFERYDLSVLLYIIPAAIVGGILGAYARQLLSPEKVTYVFQSVILVVICINLYNIWQLLP